MTTDHLAARWAALVPEQPDVGADLVARYASPDRHYHGLQHLREVLDHVDLLADEADDPPAVACAAWFHDAVYQPGAPDNEERSALLAEATLVAPAAWVAEVARLVRLTASHAAQAGDRNGAVLCDADLAILAAAPDRYREYTLQVRREHALVPDADFARGRAQVLRSLLGLPRLFRTRVGARRWEAAARANVEAELATLT